MITCKDGSSSDKIFVHSSAVIHCPNSACLADWAIRLKILPMGVASSGPNSLISFLGRSPGTPDFGLFAANIFSWISCSKMLGILLSFSGSPSLSLTLFGRVSLSRGGNSLLILEKCSAIFSADSWLVKPSWQGRLKMLSYSQSPGIAPSFSRMV